MTIAATVERYLKDRHVQYDTVTHPHTPNSIRTASAAAVPAHRLAKAVVLEDERGFVMAVVPADRHVKIGQLSKRIGRKMGLATEGKLKSLFSDCETGAVPPLGDAYGLTTIVDDELADSPEIFFEAGDHLALIRMQTRDFMGLMRNAAHGHFAAPLR